MLKRLVIDVAMLPLTVPLAVLDVLQPMDAPGFPYFIRFP